MTFNIPYLEGLCEIPNSEDPQYFYYEATNEVEWDYTEGLSGVITNPQKITINFPTETENMYLHIAIPSNISFNIYQRSGYDSGLFQDLFSLQDVVDGYDIYVSNWETGTNQILILS